MMLHHLFRNNIQQLLPNAIRKVALAVSGGADSLGLMLLFKDLISQDGVFSHLELIVIIVDHDLRKSSKFEADYVQTIAHDLGLKCFVLKWLHDENVSNLQARARIARYDLMTDLCSSLDILVLATGHHCDDFLETFCLRTERKSGILGLSSAYTMFHNNIMIIRPLANISKAMVVSFLKSKNIQWCEDESNHSVKYIRNRIRQNLALQLQENLVEKLELVNAKAQPLQQYLIKAIAECVSINHMGFAIIDLESFLSFDTNVQFYLMAHVITIVGGNMHIPRARSIMNVLDLSKQHTLAGCVIKKIENKVLIYREFGRIKPTASSLQDKSVWDNRFTIYTSVLKGALKDIYVSHFLDIDYKSSMFSHLLDGLSNLSCGHHKEILFTIPVIKTLEKVLCIPHISYYNDSAFNAFDESLMHKIRGTRFVFKPPFRSRFTHFLDRNYNE